LSERCHLRDDNEEVDGRGQIETRDGRREVRGGHGKGYNKRKRGTTRAEKHTEMMEKNCLDGS
jgi:hypothetical protein